MKLVQILSFLILLTGCLTQNAIIDLPPIAPIGLSVSPTSPASDTTPTVSGQTSPSVSLVLYSAPSCTGSALALGQASSTGAFALTSGTLTSGSYNFSVQATSPTGKICSSESVAYELTATVPSVSVSSPSVSVANSSASIDFTVTYTGADTVDLVDTDIFMSTTGTATCSSIVVTNGATAIPLVTLSGCTGDGSLGISVGPDTATNIAGSSLASNLSGTFVVDNTGITAATFDNNTGSYSTMPTTVVVTFPETISGTTLTSADFAVTGTCSTLPNLSIPSSTSTTATLSLTAPTCAGGETVIITLDLTGFNDAAGNPGVGTTVVTYTADTAGPSSATYSPVAGNINVIPATVDVIFSEAIDGTSVSDATFVVSGSCSPLPTATLAAVVGDTATVNLSGGTCLNTQDIIITIDLTTVNDAGGLAGVGSTSVTYTFDDVGPAVLSAAPVTTTVSSIPATVDITFDEDVLIGSVDIADLVISGTCSVYPTASVSTVASGTVMSFSLTGGTCATGETIIITLDGANITDLIGNVGSGTATETYTIDTTGPSVASFTQPSGDVASLPPSVLITYDEALDTSSVTLADVSVAGGSCTTLPTLGDGGVTATEFTVTLSGAVCSHGQTFSLEAFHTSITDVAGNAGVGSSIVTYTIDSQGPVPVAFTPAGGAVPASVSLSFDEAVDLSSIIEADFDTTGSTCTGISFNNFNSVGTTVTFDVVATCLSTQTLNISASGANFQDGLGNNGSSSASEIYTQP